MPVVLSGETGYTSNYCVHSDYVWFGTSHGRILASTDRGQHWIVAAPFTTSENAFPAYRDSLSGLGLKYLSAADTLHLLKKSTDGGNTYSTFDLYGSPFDGEIHFVPNTPNTYITTGVDATNQPNPVRVNLFFKWWFNWYPEPTILGTQMTCSQWLNDSTGWIGSFNTGTTDGIYKFNGVLAFRYPISCLLIRLLLWEERQILQTYQQEIQRLMHGHSRAEIQAVLHKKLHRL